MAGNRCDPFLFKAADSWRRKRDSLVRNYLIPHKLLIFQLARLAQFAAEQQFWHV